MKAGLRLKLLLIALGLAGAFVLVGNLAADLVVGRRPLQRGSLGFIDEMDVAVMHVILTGLPFFTLAVLAETRRRAWNIAVLCLGFLWAFVIAQVWWDSLNNFAEGANIGLGLLMLAVPIILSVVLAVVSMRSRRP